MSRPSVTIRKDGKMRLNKRYVISVYNTYFSIPANFTTDGASIPWVFQFLGEPYDGDTLDGALIHDCLYQARGRVKIDRQLHVLPRKNVDVIFYEVMRAKKTGIVQALLYFVGVRLVGWLPWYFGKVEKYDKMLSINILN